MVVFWEVLLPTLVSRHFLSILFPRTFLPLHTDWHFKIMANRFVAKCDSFTLNRPYKTGTRNFEICPQFRAHHVAFFPQVQFCADSRSRSRFIRRRDHWSRKWTTSGFFSNAWLSVDAIFTFVVLTRFQTEHSMGWRTHQRESYTFEVYVLQKHLSEIWDGDRQSRLRQRT